MNGTGTITGNPVSQAPSRVCDACDPSAASLVRTLQEEGFEAYLAGGCVRDMLIGRQPQDYDVCTSAMPDRVMKIFPRSSAIGKSFGVVQVRLGTASYEVATFRKDMTYSDGRRPSSVEFADARTDAWRRDFTINALFYDPVAFTITDYTGGLADISAKLVRAVGDPNERFAEDHLRMLRAVRFHAVLDFALDESTLTAIRTHAQQLSKISTERIRDEFIRILTESVRPGSAVVALRDLGLLSVFLPEACAMQGQHQPDDLHPEGDVFVHTVQMLNGMSKPDAHLALAVFLHDVGKPATASVIDGRLRFHKHADVGAEIAKAVLTRLRLPSDDTALICHIIKNHSRWTHVREMKVSTLRRLVGSPTFGVELELHRLDRMSSSKDLSTYDFLSKFREQLADEHVLPPAWVSGHDIVAMGVTAGPDVGTWKSRAYDLQLESRFGSREELLKWMQAEIARGTLHSGRRESEDTAIQ